MGSSPRLAAPMGAADESPISARLDHYPVDDVAFGRLVRLSRIRRGLTQVELASKCGFSAALVSRVEGGQIDGVPVRTLRTICRPLDIRVELLARGRAGDADRLLDRHHAALADAVASWLGGLAGWEVRPEVSFAIYGERGIVDLVCWSSTKRALMLVEVKTELAEIGGMLATLDRRHRLADQIVRGLGWAPAIVGTLLVVAESDANRDRVRAHGSLFAAALPERHRQVRAWLRDPAVELRGLVFFANSRPGQVIARFAAPRRVSRPRAARKVANS